MFHWLTDDCNNAASSVLCFVACEWGFITGSELRMFENDVDAYIFGRPFANPA